MKLGWIGVGKLGLPAALTFAHFGHEVTCYDVSDRYSRILGGTLPPPHEEGITGLLLTASLRCAESVPEVVARSDLIFIAVQTPHAPGYGGEVPVPVGRSDFGYQYLSRAVGDVAEAARIQQKPVTLVVVSTVLPGTITEHVRPLLSPYVSLLYNPFFIAMGTTFRNMLSPEFVLIGSDDRDAALPLHSLYATLHSKPIVETSIDSAELAKVAYNTFISMKIVFANMLMEISHKNESDCDEVARVLSLASERLWSPSYFNGGMGDGGACHPRDLIALSWLTDMFGVSANLPEFLLRARELQSRWLADLALSWSERSGLPLGIAGKVYKPDTDLVDGSAALLLASQLGAAVSWHWDPVLDAAQLCPALSGPHVVVVATRHELFRSDMSWAPGSVVVDPFGFVEDRSGVTVVRVGRKRAST